MAALAEMADSAELDWKPIATAIGEAWAAEVVQLLRSEHREVIGAWPGTVGEARMRIRVAVRKRLEISVLEELARVAYTAARRGWQSESGPDLEP